jgi:hypothetical protein
MKNVLDEMGKEWNDLFNGKKWLIPKIEEIELRNKYIKLLEDELRDLAGFLHAHNIKFKRLKEFSEIKKQILENGGNKIKKYEINYPITCKHGGDDIHICEKCLQEDFDLRLKVITKVFSKDNVNEI